MKAIVTKYHGPGNVRGARFSAQDSDGNRVFVPYDYALNHDQNHRRAAERLRDKMGWTGALAQGGTKQGEVFVFCPAVDALCELIMSMRSGRHHGNPYCNPAFKKAVDAIKETTGEDITERPLAESEVAA